MKILIIVILCLATRINCAPPIEVEVEDQLLPFKCDFSVETVTKIHNKLDVFRKTKAYDPLDSTKPLIKYSKYTAYTGDNAVQIEVDGVFVTEDYRITEDGKIITQTGQIHWRPGFTDTINYEKTDDGYNFKQPSHEYLFEVPLKTLDDALAPFTFIMDENHRALFNKIMELRKKLYLVKEKMDMENPYVTLYDYYPINAGYHIQYYDELGGLSQNSDGSCVNGVFKSCGKIQKYTIINGDIQLVGEPEFPRFNNPPQQ